MTGTTRSVGRSAIRLVLTTAAVVLAAPVAGPVTAGAADTPRGTRTNPGVGSRPMAGGCTMAVRSPHATVEAQIVNAGDFCELVAQGLADEVFRSAVIVTPGQLWYYTDTVISCRLQYGRTSGRLTIRDSAAACRWFTRRATGWRRMAASPARALLN